MHSFPTRLIHSVRVHLKVTDEGLRIHLIDPQCPRQTPLVAGHTGVIPTDGVAGIGYPGHVLGGAVTLGAVHPALVLHTVGLQVQLEARGCQAVPAEEGLHVAVELDGGGRGGCGEGTRGGDS